jgi:hypothetical protein
MTAQIKSFCPGPSAATAAISGRILFFDGAQISPLVGAVVACYDVDVGLSNELMCMAKSDGAGAFSCYYYTKLNDDRWDSGPMQYDDRWDSGPMQYDDRWDSGPMQYDDRWDSGPRQSSGPDIGCSVRHAMVNFNNPTKILALAEDWTQAPVLNVGTLGVDAVGSISSV